MQKALSLYIDNQMFQKNRLALLRLQEEEKENAQHLLEKSGLGLPYLLTPGGVLLDLKTLTSISSLKHSGLPLDFFESAYIDPCPYRYVKIRYQDLEASIEGLKKYVKKA